MEIVKQGKIPKYKVTCPLCGIEFIFEHSEIRFHTLKFAGLIGKTYCIIYCPRCKTSIWFDNVRDLEKFRLKEE